MAGLLEGEIAKAIYAGFKGKLLKGTLTREAPDENIGLDKAGDPKDVVPTVWVCQGFTEGYSKFVRANAGIPDTDLKVNIFVKSLPDGVAPQAEDIVSFRGERYLLTTSIDVDPAGALWTCQATKLQTEEEE